MVLGLFAILLMLASCGEPSPVDHATRDSGEHHMTDFKVSNASALSSALSKAKGGDRILLAGGEYGDVAIKGLNFASNVTIMSANAAAPAKFSLLTVNDSSHIVFRGLDVGRPLKSGEPEWTKYATLTNASYVTFDAVSFHGSLDGNSANDGYGLGVTGGHHITLQNNQFQQLARGAVFSKVTDVVVRGNNFHDLRSDGVDFATVKRVTIDSNTFRDFYPVGADHPDAIQFWTSGTTTASSDIVISNNQIFQGKGGGIQGIFLRDEVGTLPYQNVKITNNIAYVKDFHNGIAVLGGKNVEVSGNSVLSPTGDKFIYTIRLENITGGTLRGNLADILINVSNKDLIQTGNKFLSADKGFASKISGINAAATATVNSLIVAGFGYQLPAPGKTIGSASTGLETAQGTSFSVEAFAPSGLAESSSASAVVQASSAFVGTAIVTPKPASFGTPLLSALSSGMISAPIRDFAA